MLVVSDGAQFAWDTRESHWASNNALGLYGIRRANRFAQLRLRVSIIMVKSWRCQYPMSPHLPERHVVRK